MHSSPASAFAFLEVTQQLYLCMVSNMASKIATEGARPLSQSLTAQHFRQSRQLQGHCLSTQRHT
jgi:hypothetical protein